MLDITPNRQRDFYDLSRMYTEEGARAVFEKLCTSLFQSIYGPDAHNIRVHQGDGGIDVMVGDFSNPILNFQCKYFLNKAPHTNQILDSSRRANIKSSFQQAYRNPNFTMKEWILCLPCTLSQDDMLWWTEFKADMEGLTGIKIGIYDGDYLLNELKRYGLYDKAFGIDLSTALEDVLKAVDILTKSSQNHDPCLDRIRRIARILDADTIKKVENEFKETDFDNFYMVDLNFPVMLRVVSKGEDIAHHELNDRLMALCDSGKPAILTGNSGTGKSIIMLRAAVSWVRGGNIALWIDGCGNDDLTDAKAAQFYRDVLSLIPTGKRALLCLDNPSQWPDSLRALADAWPNDNRIQLLLAERSNRLSRMTDANDDLLHHWFGGATVAAIMSASSGLRVKNYPVIFCPDSDEHRKKILSRSVAVMARKGEVNTDPRGFVSTIMDDKKNRRISLVELIYQAQFRLRDFATKPDQLRLDWDEWKTILRKELGLKKNARLLYGLVALCGAFQYPLSTSLFARFFNIDRMDLEDAIYHWKLTRHIEPVMLRKQNGVSALLPKHDVITELFFRFHRETLAVDSLIQKLLETMTEDETVDFLHNFVRKGAVRNGYLFPVGEIDYRTHLEALYDRTSSGTFGLPRAGRASVGLGLLYSASGKNRADTLNMLPAIDPGLDGSVLTASLYTEWGRLLADLNRKREAEEKFRAVIATHSKDIPSRTELGRLLAKQPGRESEAELFLREILGFDPNNIQARTELGRLLAKQPGRESEAELFLRDTIKLKPEDIQSRTELGRLLANQPGREKEAELFLREAMQIDPKHIQSRTELGRLLAKQPGRESEAEQFLREAIRIDPKNLHPHTELGRLLAKQPGRESEAELFLQEIISIDSKNCHARVELAKLYARNHQNAKAEQLYQEVLQIDPGNQYAKDGLRRLLQTA